MVAPAGAEALGWQALVVDAREHRTLVVERADVERLRATPLVEPLEAHVRDRISPGFARYAPSSRSRSIFTVVLLDDGSGPGGARTHDQRIKSPMLYRLSYRPAAPG